MMKKLFLTLLFSIAGFCLIAQDLPDVQWAKTFGGKEGDVANSIIATTDGGFISVGYTNSKGQGRSDVWIIKTNADGKQVWEKTYGGKKYDVAKSIVAAPDGGFIITGETKSKGKGKLDIWVIKINANGDLVWDKTFGGKEDDFVASFVSITKATDNGFVIAGHTRSKGNGKYDVWVFKIDNDGKVVWEKVYGQEGNDFAASIITTPDGGYALACNSEKSPDLFKFWFIKLDDKGNMLFDRVVEEGDVANCIVNTNDGGYAIAGNSSNKDGYSNMWFMLLDGSANIVWQKTIDAPYFEYANCIQPTFDGGLLVAGFTKENPAEKNHDIRVLKMNRLGKILWEKTYGGADDDRANFVITTGADTYVLAGSTKSEGNGKDDVYLMKFQGYLFDIQQAEKDARLDTLEYLLKPKGEYEKNEDYKKRVSAYEYMQQKAIDDAAVKYKALQEQKIADSYKPVTAEITALSYYNADKEEYNVLVADRWYSCPMGLNEAPDFKSQWNKIKIKGYQRLIADLKRTELVNLYFISPVTNRAYPIGKQVSQKEDLTYQKYLAIHATDSVPVAPIELKGTGVDIQGSYYKQPSETTESVWQAELADFKKSGVESCLLQKMAGSKDLIKVREEFETTKSYNVRADRYKALKTKSVMECTEDQKFAQQEKVKSSYREANYKIDQISSYNSDKKEYNILVNRKWYKVTMTQDEAKSFKDNWKEIEVKGISRLNPTNLKENEVINLKVYHTAAGKTYPIGKQVSVSEDPYLKDFLKKK